MAFNFLKWILKPAEAESPADVPVSSGDFLDENVESAMVGLEIYLQRMAFWTCVRKIGYAIGSVEWETIRRGKKVKSKEYWTWNYSPNPNQTRVEFFTTLIGQLFLKQEALIVETGDGARYVADGFTTEKRLSGNIYRNVSVYGESIPGTFLAPNVLHFTITGEKIQRILLSIAAAEGQLMKSSASSFVRNSGRHGVLHVEELAEADPDFEDTYSDLINEKFKKYFTAENAVLPLFNGYSYDEKSSSQSNRTQSTTRDIRALMDDIVELTAQAIGMPASLATGKNVTDADFKAFMTDIVQPLVTMIVQEMNRKLYGSALVFKDTYIAANFGGVRYTDLFDVANPIDKLIGSGAFCVNDIRLRLGLDVIDEPWAWQHWMTKNYSSVEDLLTCVDDPGGDSNIKDPAAQPEEKEVQDEQTDEDSDE